MILHINYKTFLTYRFRKLSIIQSDVRRNVRMLHQCLNCIALYMKCNKTTWVCSTFSYVIKCIHRNCFIAVQ